MRKGRAGTEYNWKERTSGKRGGRRGREGEEDGLEEKMGGGRDGWGIYSSYRTWAGEEGRESSRGFVPILWLEGEISAALLHAKHLFRVGLLRSQQDKMLHTSQVSELFSG